LRDQPPSDTGAYVASAFSHMLPGPPPNLRRTEITTSQPPCRTRAIDFAGVHSYRIRRSVTNDSIALRGGPLTWGALVRIRFAVLGSIQPFRSESARIFLLRTRTANCELRMQGRTDEAPMNLIRVWCETRLQIADASLSFIACTLGALAGIGFRGMCELLRLVAGSPTGQSARWKKTRTLAELPLTAIPQGAQTIIVFAGR
jgi:hypothetical protein